MSHELAKLRQHHHRLDDAFDMFTWEMCKSLGKNSQIADFRAKYTDPNETRIHPTEIVGKVFYRDRLLDVHVAPACPIQTWRRNQRGHSNGTSIFVDPVSLYGRSGQLEDTLWETKGPPNEFGVVAYPRSLPARKTLSHTMIRDSGHMKEFREYHAIVHYLTSDPKQESWVVLKQVVWDQERSAFVRDLKRIERGDPVCPHLTFYHYESIVRGNGGAQEYADYSAIICSAIVEDATSGSWKPWRAGAGVSLPFSLENPARSSTPSAPVPPRLHLRNTASPDDPWSSDGETGVLPDDEQTQISQSPSRNQRVQSLGHRPRSRTLTNRQSKVYRQDTVGCARE